MCVCNNIVFTLDTLASEECMQEAIPFLCQYGFPIYSCPEQKVVLPTEEECERISTTTCQAEVSLAASFGLEHLIPDCKGLPTDKNITGTQNIPVCSYMVPDKKFKLILIITQ